jgi:hypothetical protein
MATMTLAGDYPWLEQSIGVQPTDRTSNTVERFLRNILGEVLHFISGIPTDEMMAQVKLDEEIRDRVMATLTRHMAYEKSVTDVIGHIML